MIISRIADSIYRYCCQDEVNAFVETFYREYKTPGTYTLTPTWKQMQNDLDFYQNTFNVSEHTEQEKLNHTNLYKNIHNTFKEVAPIFVNKKLKNKLSDYDFCVLLIESILNKIELFKRKLQRARLLKKDIYEGVIYQRRGIREEAIERQLSTDFGFVW